MIKDRLFDAYILSSLLLGCAFAAPYVACMLIKEEFRARM
jgi:hypothetical protein